MERASKSLISNLKKQKRENKFLLFLDNVKIIKDALASKKIEPLMILSSRDELPESISKLCETKSADKSKKRILSGTDDVDFNQQNVFAREFSQSEEKLPIFRVDESTISQLSSTVSGQHLICVAVMHPVLSSDFSDSNFLILDGLQDPGNVGSLIRTAFASGYENVILVDSVNSSNDKLIRSSVGAIFSINVVEMSRAEFVQFAKKKKLNLICTDMDGENIFKIDKKSVETPFGVVVGNEGQGVSEEVEKICKSKVSIPMCEGIESLNAGVSGAIVMYQLSKFNKK